MKIRVIFVKLLNHWNFFFLARNVDGYSHTTEEPRHESWGVSSYR